MHVGPGRFNAQILRVQLKDLTGPQPHFDHDDADIPEHRGRGFQVYSFFIKVKWLFPFPE